MAYKTHVMGKKTHWGSSFLPTTLWLFTACTSLVQPPAPVDAPPNTLINRASDTKGKTKEVVVLPSSAPVAKPTPYQSEAPVPATRSVPGKTHVVQAGENLFRIALQHGIRYQDLAQWNQLKDDNIKVGQILSLTPEHKAQLATPTETLKTTKLSRLKQCPKAIKLPYTNEAAKQLTLLSEEGCQYKTIRPGALTDTIQKQEASTAKVNEGAIRVETFSPKNSSAPHSTKKREASATKQRDPQSEVPATVAATKDKENMMTWAWPTNGSIIRSYSESSKGLDIGGRLGQQVLAANDGKVVYSGSGLRGYGKLIIIKHNKAFLSAYANNSQLLVKEGQSVRKGQKIAEMGNTDADQVKLHFEIRRFGKPVNPMQYLDSKP